MVDGIDPGSKSRQEARNDGPYRWPFFGLLILTLLEDDWFHSGFVRLS